MLESSKCYKRKCLHFKGFLQPDGSEFSEVVICKAFPNGIPAEIAYGDNLHDKPYPGDHGIQFESVVAETEE